MQSDRNDRPPTGLLEHLASAAGCMYVSDLTTYIWRKDIHHVLSHVPAEWYPIAEWNDAIQYFTRQDIAFVDAHHAKEFLVCHLGGNADAIH